MEGLLKVAILLGCLYGFAVGGKCPQLNQEYTRICHCGDIRPVHYNSLVQVTCTKTSEPANVIRKSGNYSKNTVYLRLEQVNMTVIPENYFKGIFISIMKIESGQIRDIKKGAFNGSEEVLTSFSMKYTDIREIPDVSNMYKLNSVSIIGARNFKSEIGPEDMSNLPVNNIRDLELVLLNIEKIKPKTFESMKNLFSLRLQKNKISSLSKNVFPSSLTLLDLGKNKLTSIPIESILRMQPESKVELNHNAIRNLRENEVLPAFAHKIRFTIEHKRFECSCAMAWIPSYFKNSRNNFLILYNAKCDGDNKRKGYYINNLEEDLFDDCN